MSYRRHTIVRLETRVVSYPIRFKVSVWLFLPDSQRISGMLTCDHFRFKWKHLPALLRSSAVRPTQTVSDPVADRCRSYGNQVLMSLDRTSFYWIKRHLPLDCRPFDRTIHIMPLDRTSCHWIRNVLRSGQKLIEN